MDLCSDCGQFKEVSMWFPSGCYQKVQSWFTERLHLVGVFGFVVFFIQVYLFKSFICPIFYIKIIFLLQLFGLISSMVLFCAARRRAGFKTYQAEKSKSLL